MANYSTLAVLLNTTEGMTVLRNNVKQDNGTDTVTGVNWFIFNGVTATTIYVSGNSWMGFGVSSQQLKVWQRDAALWSLYRQEGTIGSTKFLKLRWEGYSYPYTTAANDSLKYEVFLFDTGDIYLNFFTVPDNSYTGTKALVCGGSTYSFTVTASTPIEYSFYTQNETGSAWSVVQERYPVVITYVSEGTAIYTYSDIGISSIASSYIGWTESAPEGTSVAVSVSTDGENYTLVTNGGNIASLGSTLSTLYIKVALATTDTSISPSISDLHVTIQSEDDVYCIVLMMVGTRRFCSNVGYLTVAYDVALGNLAGQGGPVASFSVTFLPEDLIAKPHQNDQEHLEIENISAEGDRIRIYYTDSQLNEHLEISNITAVGTLIDVDDI